MSVRKQFIKYVSQNILGMLGVSLYILADTFFISVAEGADGITALNLVLPLYSVIYAIAAMLGVGSAIRFAILRAQKAAQADRYFSNAVLLVLGIRLYFIGFFFAGINIVGTGFLSATNQAVKAFFCSVLRGLVAIVVCAVIMAHFLGMMGVWLSFAVAELIALVATTYSFLSVKRLAV